MSTLPRPLLGKRVLVTRAKDQAESLASLLRDRGAEPVVVPTIEIHPPSDPSSMVDAVREMRERYDWIVVTSVNGALRLWAEVQRQGQDACAFDHVKIAAIGPGTAAALERCGRIADLTAKEHRQEGLASEMRLMLHGATRRVLFARAETARDALPKALREAGCVVDEVAVYRTLSPPPAALAALTAQFAAGEIDVVMFTSSSTVEHLCDALGTRAPSLLAATCVASIGPVTTETALKRGVRVDVTAHESTILGLVTALEKHFQK